MISEHSEFERGSFTVCLHGWEEQSCGKFHYNMAPFVQLYVLMHNSEKVQKLKKEVKSK
jgi:hypothetical protein